MSISHTARKSVWTEAVPVSGAAIQSQVTLDGAGAVRIHNANSLPADTVFGGTVLSSRVRPTVNRIVEAGEALYIRAVGRSSRVSIESSPTGDAGSANGWADYKDSTYTEQSPFVLPANTDTILPNDGVLGVRSQEPAGIDLYDGSTNKITGRNGDGLMITLEYRIERQSQNGEFDLQTWWDIGGSIGPLYPRYDRLRGAGVSRPMVSTTGVYTLNTWETNGALTYLRSNVACNIWDIRHVIHRTHVAQ